MRLSRQVPSSMLGGGKKLFSLHMPSLHHDPSASSEFLWILCNPGSENALKQEVHSSGLEWRSSYQEKGFVTFKSPLGGPLFSRSDLLRPFACARRMALSLGKFPDVEAARAAACAFDGIEIHQVKISRRDSLQHVHPAPRLPQKGAAIATLIETESGACWAGVHWHAEFLSPDPGGASCIEMPAHSPSRAWLKWEEARRFWQLDFANDEIFVELGCAPGGVLLALLERGHGVIGVDPANLSDCLASYAVPTRAAAPTHGPWLYHCRRPAALCGKKDLGSGIAWFMSDMNQRPAVVLQECARFCQMCCTIRGVFINLKLTDFSELSEQAQWIGALYQLGFSTVRLQQMLPHHREFALLGLR